MSATFSEPPAPISGSAPGKLCYRWLLLSVVLCAIVLAWASLQRHWNLASAEDLAMFDQMLWNVRQGQGLLCSVSGNGNLQFLHHFFGEHVSPILYLLAWPAGLTQGPEALLVFQALVFALAALPLYRLVLLLTASGRIALGAAVGWLLQPALWGAVLYDFHMEAFEALFLFSFALALWRNRGTAVLWAVLYASCKEDAPLYLAAVAVLLGWKGGRWRLGLFIAGGAMLYFLAAVLWLGPACSPSGQHLLIGRMLTPKNCGGLWAWLQAVPLHPTRWLALTGHLLALGLLPVLGGRLLIPAAMAVGVMWIARGEAQALILIHYPLTVYPLLALAAVAGLARIVNGSTLDRHPVCRRLALPGICVVVLLGWVLAWGGQLESIRSLGLGREDGGLARSRALTAAVASIPAEQPVFALPTLAAHIARRQKLNLLDGCHEADWLILRLDGQGYPYDPCAYHAWLNRLLGTNSPYGVYALASDQTVVLRRGHSRALNVKAQACARFLEAESLNHKIGHGTVDFAARTGVAWEASRYERQDYMIFGPYPDLDFPPGRYRVGFRIKADKIKTSNPVNLEVTGQHGRVLHGKIILDRPTRGYEWLELEVSSTGESLEFRCWKSGYGNVRLDAVRWHLID